MAFGEGEDIRFDAVAGEREHFAGASEAADHLVGDQQDIVLVADGAHAGEVVVRRHENAADALHRFGDQGGHGFRPFADDRFLQIARCGLRRQFRPPGGRLRSGKGWGAWQ